MTKIELLTDIPVDPACGLTKGKVLEIYNVIDKKYIKHADPTIVVIGDNGQRVNLYEREFKRLKDEKV